MENFLELKTKKDRIAFIRQRLGENSKWALRGLLRISEFQTSEEFQKERCELYNKVGFTAFDAEILTSFSKQYKKRKFLTPKQMAVVFKAMPKYAGQLEKLAS
jgi:hypothetical protein